MAISSSTPRPSLPKGEMRYQLTFKNSKEVVYIKDHLEAFRNILKSLQRSKKKENKSIQDTLKNNHPEE